MNKKFKKNERIKSKLLVNEVFRKGTSLFFSPFRIVYLKKEALDFPQTKIMISVPKKKIKKAVDRNYIKRITINNYRENKSFLSNSKNNYLILFIYLEKKIFNFSQINASIKTLLSNLEKSRSL